MYVTPTWNFCFLYQINSDDRTAVGISRINGVDAAQLPNFTTAIPNMLDSYVVELDVFHQLHCLNALRKTLFPLRYPDQFTDFYTKEGQRNYTSNDARHYGEALCSLTVVMVRLNKYSRSLHRHDKGIFDVPCRRCYDLLAVGTVGSGPKAKVGGHPYLQRLRGDSRMGKRK
jgi:hypothetical protein